MCLIKFLLRFWFLNFSIRFFSSQDSSQDFSQIFKYKRFWPYFFKEFDSLLLKNDMMNFFRIFIQFLSIRFPDFPEFFRILQSTYSNYGHIFQSCWFLFQMSYDDFVTRYILIHFFFWTIREKSGNRMKFQKREVL